jgi:transposase InsO family protein
MQSEPFTKLCKSTGLGEEQRPRVLTDNGSAFVSNYLKEYFKEQEIKHVKCDPFHPMTQGKIERHHRWTCYKCSIGSI